MRCLPFRFPALHLLFRDCERLQAALQERAEVSDPVRMDQTEEHAQVEETEEHRAQRWSG